MRSRIWADRCGKSSILFVPYFGQWAAMVYTVQMEWPYWITLTLAVVRAAFWFGFLSFSTIAAMDPSLRRAGATPS